MQPHAAPCGPHAAPCGRCDPMRAIAAPLTRDAGARREAGRLALKVVGVAAAAVVAEAAAAAGRGVVGPAQLVVISAAAQVASIGRRQAQRVDARSALARGRGLLLRRRGVLLDVSGQAHAWGRCGGPRGRWGGERLISASSLEAGAELARATVAQRAVRQHRRRLGPGPAARCAPANDTSSEGPCRHPPAAEAPAARQASSTSTTLARGGPLRAMSAP